MSATDALLLTAVIVTFVGGAIDLRTGHIPNVLTFGALGAGLVAHLVLGGMTGGVTGAATELGYSILGMLACAALPVLLYAMGAMFGGDVKMLAAVGTLLHPWIAFEVTMYAFAASFFLGIAEMAWRGKLKRVLANTGALATNPFRGADKKRPLRTEEMTKMRFGPSIFVGVAVAAYLHWGAGT